MKNKIFLLAITLVIAACSTQYVVIDNKFECLDANGLMIKYEFKYTSVANRTTDNSEYQNINSIIRSISRNEIGKFQIVEILVTNRDSIENEILSKINAKLELEEFVVSDLIINNVLIPDFIKKAMGPRYDEIRKMDSYN